MSKRFLATALAAAAALSVPGGLAAQQVPDTAEQPAERLSVAAGETVTARIADGRFIVTARERGEASGEVPEGTVRFSMTSGGMTLLQVENGTGRPFEYRARMFRGRRSATTSTCTVLPGVAGIEQWPGGLDRLELSAPELLAGSDAGIRCR